VTAEPMSIGPAPGLYPPFNAPVYFGQPVVGFDGRLVPQAFGPPVYPGPVFGPPVLVAPADPRFLPPQPVPIAANFAPSPELATPVAVETRRTSGTGNLRLTVSEAFLNRVIAQERVEPGPVRDYILGAQVTGRQTTVSRVRLDLKPSNDKATAAFVLNGDVQTLTTGVTPQAMIDTAGQQQFLATKEVYFDGVQFSTRHATVFIRARNQTVGATTPLSGTLFGGIANRIAYAAAERQKSAGEAVARDRLAEKLFPTFDGEVDGRLSQANRQLEPLRKRLDAAKLLPTSQAVWTSDTHLFHEMQIGTAPTAISSPVTEGAEPGEGLRLSIHESLLNTLVDRAGLKGFKTTDKKLRELEKSLLSAAGSSSDDAASDDGAQLGEGTLKPPVATTPDFVTDIEFDENEPMVMKLERDQLIVTIKAHFKPAGQAIVPPMTVTIPYRTELTGNKIRWVAGQPRVVAQDRNDPAAPQTIVETTIQKVIEGDLIPLEFDRVLPAALWTGSGPAPKIASVKSDSGWVTITIE
ncbi:MAG: hypothetical protein WCJ09_29505, partial [Planctomycetota bacterium]